MKKTYSILPTTLVACTFAALSAFGIAPSSGNLKFVEYIESDTDNQPESDTKRLAYIDTEYVPNANTVIEMEFSFTAAISKKTYVFGTYGSGGGRLQFSYGPASAGCFIGYGNTYTNSYVLPYDNYYNTERHVVKYVPGSGKGFYFDGERLNPPTNNLTTWAGTSTNLYLGAVNPGGGKVNTTNNAPIRIYSCKIWETNKTEQTLTLVRDFRPAFLTGADAGLYDVVHKKHYRSPINSKGTFIPGGNVVDVPTEYLKASYIEANQTAFINTEYVPNKNTGLEMKFSFINTNLTSKTYVFGTYGSGGGRLQFSYGPENCLFGFGGQDNYDGGVTGFAYNTQRHVVNYVCKDGFYFDGTKVLAKTGVDLVTWGGISTNLYLGACNRNEDGVNTDLNAPIRIYSCKIWETNTTEHTLTLKRDLVPMQRVFDGKNGLYDNVNEKFYAYYGTGDDFTVAFPRTGLLVILR